ncbi:FOG: Predicted E3 ubiquitin ligase [Phaffia rhodozyma]|uniref:FOG: Predicted E3 ubiquitin ligase n=1 Tax=Phaffia rhodozyma TaxID=264483 RepID=A0A0F7SWS7_PHARH|nr:FOG: Predicted E3 ubiquitin ligase [Phaffia rhodozyma]
MIPPHYSARHPSTSTIDLILDTQYDLIPSIMPVYWFCHACENQILQPRNSSDGVQECPNCSSDFLEAVEAEDEHEDEPQLIPIESQELDLDIPGAFPQLTPSPSTSSVPSRTRTPDDTRTLISALTNPTSEFNSQPSTRRRREASGPIFRIGLGGGSITIGGDGGAGSANSGRRSGLGARIGTDGLNTSYTEGVPSLAEFLNNRFSPTRERPSRGSSSDPFLPYATTRAVHPNHPSSAANNPQSIFEVMSDLLDAIGAHPDPDGAENDPFQQIMRSRGGLGAIFGTSSGGMFGDYATSQEAFDRIITQLASSADSTHRPIPASKSQINDLPVIPISSIYLDGMDDKNCTICMSAFEPGEEGKKLPCTHLFHSNCISTWLETNGTCPICRYSLISSSSSGTTSRPLPTPRLSSTAHPFPSSNMSPSGLSTSIELSRPVQPSGSDAVIVVQSEGNERTSGSRSGFRKSGAASGTSAVDRERG